jgi:hypothetical protein
VRALNLSTDGELRVASAHKSRVREADTNPLDARLGSASAPRPSSRAAPYDAMSLTLQESGVSQLPNHVHICPKWTSCAQNWSTPFHSGPGHRLANQNRQNDFAEPHGLGTRVNLQTFLHNRNAGRTIVGRRGDREQFQSCGIRSCRYSVRSGGSRLCHKLHTS